MKIKSFLKLGGILAAWSVIACVALAATQVLTEKAAVEQDRLRTEAALRSLFPDMENSAELSGAAAENLRKNLAEAALGSPDRPKEAVDAALLAAWAIKRKDAVIGLALKVSGPSYSGRAEVLTGVDTLNQITGVTILKLDDTPGLGQNARSPGYFIDASRTTTWYGQFAGKPAADRFAVGSGPQFDVQAITASTITSKGLASIIRVSAAAALPWLTENALSGGSE